MDMLLSLFFFISTLINANGSLEPIDRWLVELKSEDGSCLAHWRTERGQDEQPFLLRKLPVGHWWVIQVPAGHSDELRQLSCVVRMTEDRKIEWRKQPNDPAYIHQSDMNLIGMPRAWDTTTGGITAYGDTITVALIDDGYQVDHPDLVPNLWINYGEIAGDEIDNDGNGYIDDRIGFNVSTDNDQHARKTHGTSVAGVVGAKGNNTVGVSGVNWNVKLLLVSGGEFESQVIEAYQYVLDARKRYDDTDGAQGAYVVATNLSGGINFAWADEHPLWCEMYDKLGERGVLSVTAAPNDPISVDEFGDMPTTCTSPYMLTVTNVDPDDIIMGNAGFGPQSIDMGAPGEGTFTTVLGGKYDEFPGTSAAAPHVAGAIALICSTPCPDLLADAGTDPSGTADRIRNLVFTTAKPNNSLDEITVTGRRLQVDAALKKTLEDCGLTGEGDIDITSVRPNPVRTGSVEVQFEYTGDITNAFYEVFTATGALLGKFNLSFQDIERKSFILDTRSLPAAVYMLTLRLDDKKITRKLVVL